MTQQAHDESQFHNYVRDALDSIQQILEVDRRPQLAEVVDHDYQNKYELAESLTNTLIIAIFNALRTIGLTDEILKTIDKTTRTTLRFQATDSYTYLKESIVNVEVPRSPLHHDEIPQQSNALFFTTTKPVKNNKGAFPVTVKKVKEYQWKAEVKWEIALLLGMSLEDRIVLCSRQSSAIISTRTKNETQDIPSLPKQVKHFPLDLSLEWIIRQIDTYHLSSLFQIQKDFAMTPRRNRDIDQAISFARRLSEWSNKCKSYFIDRIEVKILGRHNPAASQAPSPKLRAITARGLFCPILPLMEDSNLSPVISLMEDNYLFVDVDVSVGKNQNLITFRKDTKGVPPPILAKKDMIKLLNEQVRTLDEVTDNLIKAFPGRQVVKLVSVGEASVVLCCVHLEQILQGYIGSMNYIEDLLHRQMLDAIGRDVSAKELDTYVKSHNSILLYPPPQPFCKTIRRPKHYPEGQLLIARKGEHEDPVETLVQVVESPEPLTMKINAATTLKLTGNKYLHGWLQHQFHSGNNSYELVAQARQLSSFILVVGKMLSPDELEPANAIIVQNKDEIIIPLLLEDVPSSKAFKDAILSLSPEQQRFAEEFRTMQNESSLMGLCVIQIKPQLETLLGLPPSSLSKEVQLAQDLTELFVDHQVPTDLLVCDDGRDDQTPTAKEKIEIVKRNVETAMKLIERSKKDVSNDQESDTDFEIVEKGYSLKRSFFGDKKKKKNRSISFELPYNNNNNNNNNTGRESSDASNDEPVQHHKEETASNTTTSISAFKLASRPSPKKPIRDDFLKNAKTEGKSALDVTLIPKLIEEQLEAYGMDRSLRSTIVKTEDSWSRRNQTNARVGTNEEELDDDLLNSEKKKAYALLDALSCSGSLPIDCSELHVIVALTHSFHNDLIGTVIRDNINPIEKLEKSILLVASTIYGVPVHSLVRDAEMLGRLEKQFPALFNGFV